MLLQPSFPEFTKKPTVKRSNSVKKQLEEENKENLPDFITLKKTAVLSPQPRVALKERTNIDNSLSKNSSSQKGNSSASQKPQFIQETIISPSSSLPKTKNFTSSKTSIKKPKSGKNSKLVRTFEVVNDPLPVLTPKLPSRNVFSSSLGFEFQNAFKTNKTFENEELDEEIEKAQSFICEEEDLDNFIPKLLSD